MNKIILKGKLTNTQFSHKIGDVEYNKSNLIGKIYSKLTVLEETEKRDVNGNVIWKCQCECGNITYVSTSSLNTQNTCSCGFCKISVGEETIKNLLTQNNIIFEQQKRYDTCRFQDTNYPARFDFYIVNNNYLIEFDGIQHFSYTNTDWNTEAKFNKTKEHDEYKNTWCKENNIPLIRIPYTHLKDLCIEDLQLETTKWRVV